MPAPQSLTNLALERRAEEKALGDLATAYAFFGSTQDHADAMSATCKWAIIFGFEPAACWVLTPMLAAKRPTHAVAFHKGTSPPVSGSHHRRGSIWGNLDGKYAPEAWRPCRLATFRVQNVDKYRILAEAS